MYYVDWSKASGYWREANYLLLLGAVVMLIAERLIAAYKWYVLISSTTITLPFWRLMAFYLIGNFWGLILPSSFSVDLVRGIYLYGHVGRGTESASSVLVDRVLGVISLLLFVAIGLVAYSAPKEGPDIIAAVVVIVASLGSSLIILINNKAWQCFVSILGITPETKAGRRVLSLRDSFVSFGKTPFDLGFTFVLSILLQLARIGHFYILSLAFGIDVALLYFFISVPILLFAVMVPISLGGWGVREGSMVAMLGLIGISIEEAVVISFTNSLLVTVVALAGGAAHLAVDKSPIINFLKNRRVN